MNIQQLSLEMDDMATAAESDDESPPLPNFSLYDTEIREFVEEHYKLSKGPQAIVNFSPLTYCQQASQKTVALYKEALQITKENPNLVLELPDSLSECILNQYLSLSKRIKHWYQSYQLDRPGNWTRRHRVEQVQSGKAMNYAWTQLCKYIVDADMASLSTTQQTQQRKKAPEWFMHRDVFQLKFSDGSCLKMFQLVRDTNSAMVNALFKCDNVLLNRIITDIYVTKYSLLLRYDAEGADPVDFGLITSYFLRQSAKEVTTMRESQSHVVYFKESEHCQMVDETSASAASHDACNASVDPHCWNQCCTEHCLLLLCLSDEDSFCPVHGNKK